MEQMRPITIEVDGLKKRDVLSLRYSFHQSTDSDGQPSGKIACDGIYLRVKSLEDGNTEFAEWMTENMEYKDGKIVFMSSDRLKKMKELTFKRGYLVFYQETYDEGSGYIEEFEITPQSVGVGGAVHEEVWAQSY